MKHKSISKLLQALLFGAAFFRFGITGDEGGGAGDPPPAGDPPAGTPPADGTPPAGDGTPPAGSKPSDTEARLLKEVMQKKEALKGATAELTAIKEQLKQFEGIDPAAVRALLAEQKTLEEKQLEAKGDYERLKGRMAEEHQKETTTLKDQIAALQAELGKTRSTVNELSIGTLFGQSQFITGETTLPVSKARALYADHFDLEDGKVVGYDKPRGAANRTAIVDQYGNAVEFESAMRKIIEADPDKDHLLKSKVKPGAGSESKRTDPKANAAKIPEADATAKIAAGLKGLKLLNP